MTHITLARAAVITAGVLAVAGCASSTTSSSTAPARSGPAVGVVRDGPAVLTSVSLSGGAAGRSLQVPGAPGMMVTIPDGTRSFLLDPGLGRVTPVDLAAGRLGSTIAVGKLPVDETLSTDGRTLYVIDNLGGALIPIDTATGFARAAQPLTSGVDLFVPSPVGTTGIVGMYGSRGQPGTVYFYDLASGKSAVPFEVGRNLADNARYSPDGRTVWISEQGVGSLPGVVIPVDVATRTQGQPIPIGHTPSGLTMTYDGRLLLVSNALDSSVSVVDLAAHAVVSTIAVGAGPGSIELSADGGTAWVACGLSRTLVPITIQSRSAGGPVALANAPSGLGMSRPAGSAWVLFPSSPGNVSLFDTSREQLDSARAIGNGPTMVIARDSSTAWVANGVSDTVQHIDTSSGAAGSPIPVARAPEALALSRDSHTLFVLSFGDGTGSGYLTPIDTASSRARDPLPVGAEPSTLALTADGATALVANRQANSITTVDVKRWMVGPSISLPCSPTQMLVTPDSATLYVVCDSTAQLLPVTVKSRAVGASISIGSNSRLTMANNGRMLFLVFASGLEAIDVSTNTVRLSRHETGNIIRLMPTPDDTTLLAIDNLGGALLLINPTTLATTKSISVATRPDGLEVAPDGAHAYILDTGEQKLYSVDLKAARVMATIDVSPGAQALAVPARQP